MRHAGCRRRTVPVFLSRRAPDDIARSHLHDGSAGALHEAATAGDDEHLPERMGVPRASRTRLERDDGSAKPGWRGRCVRCR